MYRVLIRVPNGQMVPYQEHRTALGALRATEYAVNYLDVIVRDCGSGREVPLYELRRLARDVREPARPPAASRYE